MTSLSRKLFLTLGVLAIVSLPIAIGAADKGHTWSEPQKLAEPLTTGYTLLAKTGPDSCVVLTRRVVLPGESREGVLDKWAHDWDWKNRSRQVLEARRITVGP